ncbi:helix-hairpin-helix domain-containing protein [Candidatus Kaiserbacteria bacterium]|nr:helix-hairpin-helix domain-containing protein [Candidatus Kaiserbacteria bacterium]
MNWAAPIGTTRVWDIFSAYPWSDCRTRDFTKPYEAITYAFHLRGGEYRGYFCSHTISVTDDQGNVLWEGGAVRCTKETFAKWRANWARDQALLSTPLILTSTLDVLDLPAHIKTLLEQARCIYSVDALIRCDVNTLLECRGIGPKSIEKIREALRKAGGFELGMKLA